MSIEVMRKKKYTWNDVELIAARIADGAIGIVPTETVPGLVALPSLAKRVNELKGGLEGKPLALLIADDSDARNLWGESFAAAQSLVALWPGPLTLIAGGGEGLALRMPDHDQLRRLLRLTGPLLGTSANLSGRPAPADLTSVDPDLLELVDFVVEEDRRPAGLASTILRLSAGQWQELRPGAVKKSTWLPLSRQAD
ncbi:MAG: Sua5/YciO/YrdC/YwlC family protein [Planctomycetes bacterium]|nr:Sua5/YciO/YrdC/YwlC family protein [Planctomycetota bacterium]